LVTHRNFPETALRAFAAGGGDSGLHGMMRVEMVKVSGARDGDMKNSAELYRTYGASILFSYVPSPSGLG
jgi:hypothetical protein